MTNHSDFVFGPPSHVPDVEPSPPPEPCEACWQEANYPELLESYALLLKSCTHTERQRHGGWLS